MIARVFPTKTSMSPNDEHAYFGPPDDTTPKYKTIFVSCTFVWDILKAQKLQREWRRVSDDVRIGGPAFNSPAEEFVPGMFLKHGVVITSRGCPNNCSFCLVPRREGKIRELEVKSGHIIQDNNILACSKQHLDKVFQMLQTQKAIEFKGGLETRLVTDIVAKKLRSLKIKSLWLACDTKNALVSVKKTVQILKNAGFKQYQFYCYVLIGKDMVEEEQRLREVYNAGLMPFAQLYRDYNDTISYDKKWRQFQRLWARPAIIRTRMKELS